MKQRKRIAALLAAGVMLFSSLPANALGAERQTTGGLCEHHPAHTAECGYAEGTEGASCNHQHTDECYTFVTNCVHAHGADCYPAEGVSDNAAAPSGAETVEPTACTHQCSEESGCIKKELNCQHEHNSECGYTPAAEGAPCTYVCPICPVQEQINALPTSDELGNMTEEEQQAVYEKLQTAYDAYNVLTDEQKAEITGAEIFESLFAVFNGMVNTLAEEQFTSLTPGETYWFDLSDADIPGTVITGNTSGAVSVPDTTLTWVPFTYAGTINAYSLDEDGVSAEDNVTPYDHSLFIADYAVTHSVKWNDLDAKGMIFGTTYTSGGVDYTLRAPSGGSSFTGSGESERSIPKSNEWDVILDKNSAYIKNWSVIYSWGQDLSSTLYYLSNHVGRGRDWPHSCTYASASSTYEFIGFRPVLEIPNTLDSDSQRVVTIDLNGGSIGSAGSTADGVKIVVKSDESFTAPSNDGLTRPTGNDGDGFYWMGSDDQTYAPGADVPASVTKLTAQWEAPPPTFSDGETYWFNLSDAGIPGTVNTGTEYYGAVSVPDTTLTWVPFTYTGTINAYSREEEGMSTEDNVTPYNHSLFIADYAVTHSVNWSNLESNGMIFGTDYTSGGVEYTLRAPSVGSTDNWTGEYESERGIPESNEWDVILNTNIEYIKNWENISSLGQDTDSESEYDRVSRGGYSVRGYESPSQYSDLSYYGFRPVLEIPATLASDSLRAVAVKLNGGKIGSTEGTVNIAVKSNESFTAPSGDGLTAPEGMVFGRWLGSDGQTYEPGEAVPASVTTLTAQWAIPYISYSWDENAQKLVRSDTKTTGPYTLLTDGSTDTNWAAGWYVVEGTVDLPARVTVTGDVHLILKDGCKLNANQGIQVGTGNSLTIYAQSEDESKMGCLTATGRMYAAGIGGEGITICGGIVTATGGNSGAGIGGGDYGAGKDITIYGGIVTATGEIRGAGIGGGNDGAGEDITIYGGTVTATGGDFAAGIGGGDYGAGQDITIKGGTVTATGGLWAAGIGGGSGGSGENIIITNGSVKTSSISPTPTDGNGNEVYLAKLEVQSGVNEVTLDSGAGEKTFKRAGDHPDGDTVDTAFYLYLTGKDHEITVSNTKYKAIWNDNDGFDIKLAVSAPTVTIAETTASSITVEELADKETYGGAEYSLDGRNWQTSNVLTGLHSNTIYTVHARYKGDTIYATSDAGKVEGVSTSAASYTITIPAVTLEAGKADSSASLAVDTEKNFDLGYKGHVDITVKNDSNVTEDAKLNLTRQNDPENHTITSALLVDNKVLGNIQNIVATFKAKTDIPVTISFASPTETNILAGTYSGTITFEVSYTEPKT